MMKCRQLVSLCVIAFITLGFTIISGCSNSVKESSSSSAIISRNNSSSTVSDSSEISNSSQQAQAQSSATSSDNESAQKVSIPTFKGTVSNSELPLIKISKNEWEQAKQDFISEYPFIKSTMKSVNISDFALSDNWHGILNKEQFKLNVYSLQAQFLLVVSEYGNNSIKIKLFISSPKSVFAFYGDSVWLLQEVKGIGEPLNIITDEIGGLSSDDLDLEFDQLFTNLSAIESNKCLAGTKIQIDGYNLLIMRDMRIVVIDK